MAQNITLLGASYSNVPAVTLPKTGGGTATFTDTTIASGGARAEDIISGSKAYVNGSLVTGSMALSNPPTSTTNTHTGNLVTTIASASSVRYLQFTKGFLSQDCYYQLDAGGSGMSKNTQVVQGTTRTTSSTMTAIGAELTVSKTGTYDIYWSAFRSSTSSSYTYATQLYIDGTAHGSENASWSNHCQNNHLTSVSLTANQKLRVRGRESRNSSYYIYAPMLVIVEN